MTGLFGGIFILFQHSHFVVFCLHVRVQIWSIALHMCCSIYGVFFTIVPYGELDIVITFSGNHCAFQMCPGLFQGWIVDRADYKSLSCLLLSLRSETLEWRPDMPSVFMHLHVYTGFFSL